MAPTFAAFEESEHRARLARSRAALKEQGFDVCVSIAPEHLNYYGGYDAWVSANSFQAMIYHVDGGEPTMVVRDCDLPLCTETSWVTDVRTYHLYSEDVAEIIAGIVREKGPAECRIAVEMKSNMLTWPMGQALFKALHPATVSDGTRALGDLLLVKSEAEMVYMREAGRYAEIGRAATRAALRPGITEIELAAALEGSMRGAGSDYWSIPTELSSGPRTPGGHATPRERPIEPGDLVHIEYAGVSHRYHTVVCHTLALGDPGPRAREVYDVARASLRAGMDAIRPGVPVADVEDASFEPVRRAGLMDHCLWRYGYGVGIAYPPIWLGTLQISEGFDHRLEVGMTFTLHAWLGLNDENIGLLMGGSYVLTDDGLEQLCGGGDVELDVVPV